MSWLPHLVTVMWEVLQRLRCDRSPAEPGLLTVKVPTPHLARQECRWCLLLEDDTYQPVQSLNLRPRDRVDTESKMYREEREGEVRERMAEDEWRGRSPGLGWRGRSVSRSGDYRETGSEGWRGRAERSREWRGRSPGLGGGDW